MIYEHLLPDAFALGRQYYVNLAILQTSTSIHEEVLRVLGYEGCLVITIQDRESHHLSL